MKTKRLFWIFTLTLLALSCAKEKVMQEESLSAPETDSQPAEPQKPPRPQMTLSAFSQGAEDEAAADAQAEEGSKLTFIDNSATTGKFAVAWDMTISNETIRVLGKDAGGNYIEGDNVVLTGSNRISAHKAEFSGDKPSEASVLYDILYPSDYESIDDFYTRGFGQTQACSGSTAHLSYNAMFQDLDQCEYVNFSARWAEEQGLDFYCTSCLKIILQVPDEVSVVKEFSITSTNPTNFYRTNDPASTTNTLAISLADGTVEVGTYRTVTLYLMLAGFDQTLSTSNTYTIRIIDGDGWTWTRTWSPSQNVTMQMGNMYKTSISKKNFVQTSRYVESGTGTAADPYIISTPYQMDAARNLLVNVVVTDGDWSTATSELSESTGVAAIPHFKLANDLDMSSFSSWNAWVGQYRVDVSKDGRTITNKYYSFDGDGHTISNLDVSKGSVSYAGLFGLISYKLTNLTLDNFSCTGRDGNPFGLVASWLGGQQTYVPDATISDVHVTNSTIDYAGSSSVEIGAFASRSAHVSLSDCTVENCVITQASSHASENYSGTTTYYTFAAGGLIGRSYGKVYLTDCESIGNQIVSNKYYSGGIIGLMGPPDNGSLALGSMSGCSCSSTIASESRYAGGLVGAIMNYDADATPFLLSGVTPCSFTGDVTALTRIGGIVGGRTLRFSGASTTTMLNVSNCVVDGSALTATIVSTGSSATSARVGGIIAVGETDAGPLSISDCSVNATMRGDASVGGILSHAESTTTIEDCSSAGSIQYYHTPGVTEGVPYQYAIFGGVAASNAESVTINHCKSTVDITSVGTSCGGVFGQAGATISVSQCHYNGSITSTKNYVAGIVAYARYCDATISECFSEGSLEITSTSSFAGGIVGRAFAESSANDNTITHAISVTDCLSTMNITMSGSGGVAGGIVGDASRGVHIAYCIYRNGTILSNYASGGIVGRANDGDTGQYLLDQSNTLHTDFYTTVNECIAWNYKLWPYDGNARIKTSYSNGAIVGFTNIYNLLYNCWIPNNNYPATASVDFKWFAKSTYGGEYLETQLVAAGYNSFTPTGGTKRDRVVADPVQSPAKYIDKFTTRAGTTNNTDSWDRAWHGFFSASGHVGNVLNNLHFAADKWTYTTTTDLPVLTNVPD